MKKIAVDVMGGDNAPQALVEGVNQAIRAHVNAAMVEKSTPNCLSKSILSTPAIMITPTVACRRYI